MNFHNILYQNVISSPYFKSLYDKKTYHEVIDEIYTEGCYLEPFFKGTHASTPFCLIYKLWTLKLTAKQVQGLVKHPDSPHIRAVGFLYLRYVCRPADLWSWYEPFLEDDEELQIENGPKPRSTTMGKFLVELLTENKWLGTILPRIPVPIARDLESKLRDWRGGSGEAVSRSELFDRDQSRKSQLSDRSRHSPPRHRSNRQHQGDQGRDEPRNWERRARPDIPDRRGRPDSRERRRRSRSPAQYRRDNSPSTRADTRLVSHLADWHAKASLISSF
ncbi:putative RNA binding protein [Phlyctochytrium arcticum]|nr:putative RNA binding protein [Phlyctochytrium arcticum]